MEAHAIFRRVQNPAKLAQYGLSKDEIAELVEAR